MYTELWLKATFLGTVQVVEKDRTNR